MPGLEPSRNGRSPSAPAAVPSAKRVKRFFQERTTPEVRAVFDAATQAAGKRPLVVADLANEALREDSVRSRLRERVLNAADEALTQHWDELTRPTRAGAPRLGFDLDTLVEAGTRLAREWGLPLVDVPAFLAACLDEALHEPESLRLREVLAEAGLTQEVLRPVDDAFRFRPLGFGYDLTAMARAGRWPTCPLEGLTEQLESLLVSLLARRLAVVTGPPGVGKTNLLFGLAWHLAMRTRPLIPPEMDDWVVVSVSRQDLFAGTADRGALEKRLRKLFGLLRRDPRVVIFLDELHALLGDGDPSGAIVANAVKAAMSLGGIRLVGATTDPEYARHVRADEALDARVARIAIPEPGRDAVLTILTRTQANHVPDEARAAGIVAAEEALRAAVDVTDEYQPTAHQPRKAALLLTDAAADKLYALRTGRDVKPLLSADDMRRCFSRRHGIPLDELQSDPRARLQRLQGVLEQRIQGQEHVIRELIAHLKRRLAKGRDPRRPLGRFLFVGPPGVGKSALAEELARAWLFDPAALFDLNLGSFRGEDAVNKFAGSAPGYEAHGRTRTVFSHVAMHPRSMLVLDEVDKAAPLLADSLLAVLDGRANDVDNRSVSFAQSLIVFTANTLAGEFGGLDEPAVRELLLAEGGIWRPALLDRIDRILVFRPLDEETLLRILDTRIAEWAARAGHEVPDSLESEPVRREIVRRATVGESAASARRLETELTRWMDDNLDLD